MAFQASAINQTMPLILSGLPMVKDNETLLTIGGRSTDLAAGSLMAKYTTGANAGKWAPFLNANLGATDGSQTPAGILLVTLPFAGIAAGDVLGVVILVGGAACQVDSSLLVFDGGTTTLASVPTVPTNACRTVEQLLNMIGIFPTTTIASDSHEN